MSNSAALPTGARHSASKKALANVSGRIAPGRFLLITPGISLLRFVAEKGSRRDADDHGGALSLTPGAQKYFKMRSWKLRRKTAKFRDAVAPFGLPPTDHQNRIRMLPVITRSVPWEPSGKIAFECSSPGSSRLTLCVIKDRHCCRLSHAVSLGNRQAKSPSSAVFLKVSA